MSNVLVVRWALTTMMIQDMHALVQQLVMVDWTGPGRINGPYVDPDAQASSQFCWQLWLQLNQIDSRMHL
jgi:hypothetical protein